MPSLELRDYQKTSLAMLDSWRAEHEGNPCLVLPTGSGKSILIAAFCQRTISSWPNTRIMIICSQKELVEQDADKLLKLWPTAPLGICCAAIGKKELGRQVTISSILSIFRKQNSEIGILDLIIVDEAHLINHKEAGAYRTFINKQKAKNPKLRVIGLTATPYRLGHGYITDGDAIFSAPLITPTSILELQAKGYLAMLKSKSTETKLDTEGVPIQGGEYVEHELQIKVDNNLTSEQVVRETIRRAGYKKHWLFFCTGIEHAIHVCKILNSCGINAGCITSKITKSEREKLLKNFIAGKIKAITNANVLTTGFDFPAIDLIVMMRPTMSPGLYCQMAGRGLRIADGKEDCLILDFAGNVAIHGPITNINPPKRKGARQGVAPSKICPVCDEIVAASARSCPECGYIFTEKSQVNLSLHNDDIMGLAPLEIDVYEWSWNIITAKNGKNMIVCSFYGRNLLDPVIRKFYCVWHDGQTAVIALNDLSNTANKAGIDISQYETPQDLCNALNKAKYPKSVRYRRNGKFFNVVSQVWKEEYL